MGTNFPHEQQICLFAAAEISSSYLATDVRMCEQEISGGNASEATARACSSSRRKESARSKLSWTVPWASVLCLLTVRRKGVGLDLFGGRLAMVVRSVKAGSTAPAEDLQEATLSQFPTPWKKLRGGSDNRSSYHMRSDRDARMSSN